MKISMLYLLIGLFPVTAVYSQDFNVSDSILVNYETSRAQLTLRFSEELHVPENRPDSLPFSFYVLNPPDSISVLNSKHTIRNDSSFVEITFSITPETYFSAVILDAQNVNEEPLVEPYFINFDSYTPESKPDYTVIEVFYNQMAIIPELNYNFPNLFITGVITEPNENQFSTSRDDLIKQFKWVQAVSKSKVLEALSNTEEVIKMSIPLSEKISVINYGFYNDKIVSSDSLVFGNTEANQYPNIYSLYNSTTSEIDYIVTDSIKSVSIYNIIITDVADAPTLGKPTSIKLISAYPNPFNPSTQLKVEVSQASELVLHVYDVLGRNVKSWQTPQRFTSGQHEIAVDFSGFASGTYVVELIGTDLLSGVQTRQTTKVSLVK
ncbi:T9SS type A sorting domain-containing protein [bacterium]|nr:MAG: T9SS type A sorting domain-containing protein [bacterium]